MRPAVELSVPGFASRLVPQVETRPGKVRKWLASLPPMPLAEHAREIYTALNAYNRIELEPAQRLELLELYREPVRRIVAQLEKQYVGLPLPLPAKHKGAAEQHRHFQLELAYGYKYLVLAWLGRTRAADEAALALHRAVRHLREVLLACYLSYSPQPLNMWREIHALYVEAKRLGITGLAIADPLARAPGTSTIADAYKHALLLDLADPYHLPSRMALKINEYLESHAGLASLHRGFERVEPNCHFLIDFAGDQAGVLYSQDTVLDRPERYGLLNTVELARQIHHQLMQLRHGRTPAAGDLSPDFFDAGGEELLLRLINVWGLNPKRVFRRNRTRNEQVSVAIGLEEINYWLNGGRRLVISAERMGPFPHSVDINIFALSREGGNAGTAPPAGSWKVHDESAGGMALRRSGIIRRRVKVGDVIATRVSPEEGWSIAVVRWVKSPNASEVEIGTQRLAPSAIPVLIKVMSERGKESDYMPSLLLPAVPALNEPPTLVAPRQVFRPERVLHVDDGHKLMRLTARRLLEVTSEFERMEFADDSG